MFSPVGSSLEARCGACHPKRHRRIGMAEVFADGLDALARVQEDRGVEVAKGVHPVLPGGGVWLPRFRRRDEASRRKSGLPHLDVEVAPPDAR